MQVHASLQKVCEFVAESLLTRRMLLNAHQHTHTHSHTNYGAASQSELCSHTSAAALHMYSTEKRDEATGRHDKEMRGNRKERDFRKIIVARGKKYKTFNLHFHTQHYYSFCLKNQCICQHLNSIDENLPALKTDAFLLLHPIQPALCSQANVCSSQSRGSVSFFYLIMPDQQCDCPVRVARKLTFTLCDW